MIGSIIAHFKITGKLGEGGMGEVYRAEIPTAGYGFDLSSDGETLLVATAAEESGQTAKMDPLTLVLNWTADLERR